MNIKIDCIIGIDPGVSGGIAVWRTTQPTTVMKMPRNIYDLRAFLDDKKQVCNPVIFLEKVQLQHGDMSDNPGKVFRIQKMLAEFEKLKAVITLCDIPYVLVNPMKWQSDLKLRVKGEEKADRKRRYQRAAAEYYPEIKATLWNSDALMILHFGRYILHTNPRWVLDNLPQNMHPKLF